MTRKSVYALLLGAAVVAGGCQKKEAAPGARGVARGDDDARTRRPSTRSARRWASRSRQQVKPLNLTPAEMEILKKALAASLAGEKPQYDDRSSTGRCSRRGPRRSAATAAAAEKEKSRRLPRGRGEGGGRGEDRLRPRLQDDHAGQRPEPQGRPTPCASTTTARSRREGLRQLGPARPARRVPAEPVIPCWTEGVQRMKVGEKAKLVCPSEIAYGDRGPRPDDPARRDARLRGRAARHQPGTARPAARRPARRVKIHEYQGKAVLAQYGVPVPKGKVAYTVDEAVEAAKGLGFPVVVKAQIHAGGRGKGGGVKLAKNARRVRGASRRRCWA